MAFIWETITRWSYQLFHVFSCSCYEMNWKRKVNVLVGCSQILQWKMGVGERGYQPPHAKIIFWGYQWPQYYDSRINSTKSILKIHQFMHTMKVRLVKGKLSFLTIYILTWCDESNLYAREYTEFILHNFNLNRHSFNHFFL